MAEKKTTKKSAVAPEKKAAAAKKATAKKTTSEPKKATASKKAATTAKVPAKAPAKKAAPKKTVRKSQSAEQALVKKIAECMLEKKGENVVSLDLRKATGATFDYFVICEAQSGQQVRTIADEISDKVYADLKEDALHTEGYANGEWVLLDYGNVLAHVFQKELREHYRLEELWGDAVLEFIKDED